MNCKWGYAEKTPGKVISNQTWLETVFKVGNLAISSQIFDFFCQANWRNRL